MNTNEELRARLPELPQAMLFCDAADVSQESISFCGAWSAHLSINSRYTMPVYTAEQLHDYAIAALARQEGRGAVAVVPGAALSQTRHRVRMDLLDLAGMLRLSQGNERDVQRVATRLEIIANGPGLPVQKGPDFGDGCSRDGFAGGCERMGCHPAPPSAGEGDAYAAGVKVCIAWVEKRRHDFEAEYGMTCPDTGAMEFRSVAREEYDAELVEIEEGLRALLATPTPQSGEVDAPECEWCGYPRSMNPLAHDPHCRVRTHPESEAAKREMKLAATPTPQSGEAWTPHAAGSISAAMPASVREALQRMIEDGFTRGPASAEDARVVAQWRGMPAPASPQGVSDAVVERLVANAIANLWNLTSREKLEWQNYGDVSNEEVPSIVRAALNAVWPTAAGAAPEGWQPIETAPRDGRRVLVLLKDELPAHVHDFAGVAFVAKWLGGHSEWAFAAPVGHAGFPDAWMVGWRPLAAAPNPGAQHGQEGRE